MGKINDALFAKCSEFNFFSLHLIYVQSADLMHYIADINLKASAIYLNYAQRPNENCFKDDGKKIQL